MKSMTKMMVVAMVLVAALVVAPAAADRVIAPGDTNIYVGEENVDFGTNFPTAVRLVHYTDRAAEATDKIFTLAGGNVTEFTKGIPTGTYYLDAGNKASEIANFNVQNPEATLDVVLDNSRKDSVNGKTVTRNTVLAFKLGNNVNAAVGARINIDLTLPGGAVTNNFSNVGLTRVASGTTEYVGPISLSNAEAGTYTATAKWAKTTDFYGKGYDSGTVTFEIASKDISITSNKDSVVRGNSFAVTITGESNSVYYLYIKDAGSVSYPWMIQQNGVNFTTNVAAGTNVPTSAKANVTTTAAGTRTVQFNTNETTKDQSYTIRVEDPTDRTGKYDEVKVRVEAGSVTVTTSGTGVYYIGEEITLSGTCTEGSTVYLFMTGPNLANRGVKLEDPSQRVATNDRNNFTQANVEADDTWSKRWNTAGLSLDAGSYTIYAVSAAVDKEDLSQAKYNTASVSLRSGFVTATTSGAAVARGDKLTISGTAQGNPTNVLVWIFGKNFYGTPNSRALNAESVPVESDGSFEYELESGDTKDLAGGQYFVIVQHPMGANSAISWDSNGTIWGDGINKVDLSTLQAPAAATALINALDSPNIPDTYVKLTFLVEEPQLFIDPIGDKAAGSKFTISGTTNLAVGGTLNVEVTSAAFQPGQKTEGSAFSGVGGSTVIQKGDGANTWSMDVDATGFKPDQYIVKVESIEAGTTATATFNVIEGPATTQPTGNVTAAPTGTETTAPTTTATTAATPTQSPGFGALVALAGLGAVAFLVLRRN